jgi:hypothetical protein
MAVTIGIDPHKGSHTAAVIDAVETVLREVRVRCGASQVERLLAWAAPFGPSGHVLDPGAIIGRFRPGSAMTSTWRARMIPLSHCHSGGE